MTPEKYKPAPEDKVEPAESSVLTVGWKQNVDSKLDKLETGMTRLQDTQGNQMKMMKLMLKAQNVPEDLINQYMPAEGAGRRLPAKWAPPVSPANKGAQPSQAKAQATQIHAEDQDMADNSDNSGDLFSDGVQKRKFLDDTKRAAACTVNDIKEPIMRNAPHLVGLVLRTRSRTECVYLKSHVFDADLWTYLKETKAIERGLRITEVIDGYAVVQVRGICQAPNATDALIVGHVDQAQGLDSVPGYTGKSGITMPMSTCYSSPHATVNALK